MPSAADSKETVEGEKAAFQSVLDDARRDLANDNDFTRNLEGGVSRALMKRSGIRQILHRVEQGASWDDVIDDELETLKGSIKRVVVKPFSINLFVDGTAFRRINEEREKEPLEIPLGFHAYISEFNVIDEQGLANQLAMYSAELGVDGVTGIDPSQYKSYSEIIQAIIDN